MTALNASFSIQGSVFFALPDGNGLLYNVTGTAEGPKPINNIQREVPCKTSYTEMLTVTNWLRRPQRFMSCFCTLICVKDRFLNCIPKGTLRSTTETSTKISPQNICSIVILSRLFHLLQVAQCVLEINWYEWF